MFAQVRPWKDCNRHCDFCYLRDDERNTPLDVKKKALMKLSRLIHNEMGGYETIGLIGGELFCWDGLDTEWDCVANALNDTSASVIYIASHLMEDVKGLLRFADKIQNKKVQICTSYDTCGRFRDDIDKLRWMKNLEIIHYARYDVVCSCTMTSAFVNDPLEFPPWVDLTIQPIFLTESWLEKVTESLPTGEEYNEKLNTMNDGTIDLANRGDVIRWFSKHPSSTRKYSVYDGKHATHFWDFVDGDYIRSDFICNRVTECGHPYIARCYKNDTHCSMCDAKKVIE